VAPFINITFNQPMVPLVTLGDLTAEQVPARLEPDLPALALAGYAHADLPI